MTGPYACGARSYGIAGWTGVLPIPARRKNSPPAGFTGAAGADPTDDQVVRWITEDGNRNLALRLPNGVIGIDVDAYPTKRGGETLRVAEQAWGRLPSTWRSSSREDDPLSGIRFYRVPDGTRLAGVVKIEDGRAVALEAGSEDGGADVEIVQHHHRYALVAPSIHPEGRTYNWWRPDGSRRRPGGPLPRPGELPELPERWLLALSVPGANSPQASRTDRRGRGPDEILTEGEACATVARILGDATVRCVGGSRHDYVRDDVMRLVRLGEQGHSGVEPSLRALRGAFVAAVGPDRDGGPAEAEQEFARMVDGAAELARGEPTPAEDRGCRCGGEVRYGRPRAVASAERTRNWPAPLDEAAFHGIAGEFVRAIEPHTEADPAALLIQFLVGFGNLIGRTAHFIAEDDVHYTNLDAVAVGETAKGRKGTAWGRVRSMLARVDPDWAKNRVMGGLSTGEGLTQEVRDDQTHTVRGKVTTIPGVMDKRLLAYESEFALVLRQLQREETPSRPQCAKRGTPATSGT